MKVKELQALLANVSGEADVLVRLDGSIFPTDNKEEHGDYNNGEVPDEFFVLAME